MKNKLKNYLKSSLSDVYFTLEDLMIKVNIDFKTVQFYVNK